MIHYALQTLIFQLLFLMLYDVFHKRDTFFSWNRFYLIITPALSLLLPFIEVESFKNDISKNYILQVERVITISSEKLISVHPTTTDQNPINWWLLLYFIGIGISILLLILKLYKLKVLKTFSIKTKVGNKNIITLPNSNLAFSFWNSIYLGDALDEDSKKQILIHEMVHVAHKHSLDQLWFELLKILLWWNPLIYIYQSRITLLHEYIADAAVIASTGKQNYIEQLLNVAFQTQEIPFVNQFFNHSLIKKRIFMLQKSQSKTIAKFKYLLLIPVILGILIYTSCKNEPISPIENTTESEEKSVSTDTISKELQTTIDQAVLLTDKKIAETPCLNQNSEYNMDLDNHLKIVVGNNTEVIVDIVSINSNKSIRTVYLKRNIEYHVRNIPEDTYRLHIQYGEGYAEKTVNGVCAGYFKNEKQKEIGDQILVFDTIKTETGLKSASYNITLDLLPGKLTN
ncbi:M56 family metallopeptidase [Aquimarina sp. 2201CG1-2-11]|uniref:M56 family metallopeptidase n=1 Tax=Aquimarina discodermiae TaxID=3231043 RepID=UPI0034637569